MTKLTNKLLEDASRISSKMQVIQAKLTEAFNERYGITYSDVDADQIIDILDYGGGIKLTLAECDDIMTSLGYPPKPKQENQNATFRSIRHG